MSHFFTKDKRAQLAALNEHLDIDALAVAVEGEVLKAVNIGEGVIKFLPSVDNVGGGSELPTGNFDGQALVWDANDKVSEYHMVSAPMIGGLTVQWKSEAKWRSKASVIQIKFVQDSSAGGVVTSIFDSYGVDGVCLWTLTANWNFEDGGVQKHMIDTFLQEAIDANDDLSEYIEIVGEDNDIEPSDLGLVWTAGSGIVDGSEGGPFILTGAASWQPKTLEAPVSNKLTDAGGITFIQEDLLVMGATYDLNLVGHEMIVVVEDWGSKTGEITLRLKNGTTGQQVFIKNLSLAEQYSADGSANRVIKVQAGGDGISGKIDLESGLGFVIDPMVDMHLVCINGDGGMSGDGDWIIL